MTTDFLFKDRNVWNTPYTRESKNGSCQHGFAKSGAELQGWAFGILLNIIVNLSIRISKSPPSASPKPLYVILKKTKEMKFIIIILTVLFPFISKGQTEFLDQIKIYKIKGTVKMEEIINKLNNTSNSTLMRLLYGFLATLFGSQALIRSDGVDKWT